MGNIAFLQWFSITGDLIRHTHARKNSCNKYILLHGYRVHTTFIHEAANFHERSREALRRKVQYMQKINIDMSISSHSRLKASNDSLSSVSPLFYFTLVNPTILYKLLCSLLSGAEHNRSDKNGAGMLNSIGAFKKIP